MEELERRLTSQWASSSLKDGESSWTEHVTILLPISNALHATIFSRQYIIDVAFGA